MSKSSLHKILKIVLVFHVGFTMTMHIIILTFPKKALDFFSIYWDPIHSTSQYTESQMDKVRHIHNICDTFKVESH